VKINMANPMKSEEQREREFLEKLALIDSSKSVLEWLNGCKKSSRDQYVSRWDLWIQYCKSHGLLTSGDSQLADIQQKKESKDNGQKFFYETEIPKFFQWLKNEYFTKSKDETKKKHLTEGSALTSVTGVRSFFTANHYSLDILKDKLPSSEKIKNLNTDHAFTIFELRDMFNLGDLTERTILDVGLNLWLRVGDFVKLDRETIELSISREKELAKNEKRETQTLEFELITEKESEPCSCHLSKEAVELLEQYFKAYPQKDGQLFPYQQDMLNDILKNLATKAHIKLGTKERVRWHCLRKFGVTILHGRAEESVMKYMVGKHIDKSLRTYIQNNNETFKAFKLIEPLISLTKSNGNGSLAVTKELEKLKAESFKNLAMLKLMERITPKEEMQKALMELAEEFGIKLNVGVGKKGDLRIDLNESISELGKAIEKKDLERVLAENDNGDQH
jgi:integrase